MRWEFAEDPTERELKVVRRLQRGSKFYVFLWKIRSELFTPEFQDELAAAYKPRGQAPIPAAQLAMVWLLQAYTGLSDRDAVEQALFDLRWKLILGTMGSDEAPFGQGSLPRFRARIIEHELDQRLVDRTVELARSTGLFGWRNLRGALDSSPLRGAGRVEDTWNLLGRAIRNLVAAIAASTDRTVEELASEVGLTVLGSDSLKSLLDIDWDDASARAEAFGRLVEEASALQSWIETRQDLDPRAPAIESALSDLQRILDQDTEPDPDGAGRRLRRGVARDRMPSLGDREMRHGRKSKSKLFNGYKRHIGLIEGAGLIAGAVALPANAPEHRATAPLVAAIRTHGDLDGLDIDRGYLASPEIATLDRMGVVVRCKPWPSRNRGRFSKADFQIELARAEVTCPANQVVPIRTSKKGNRAARFPATTCQPCSLREKCTLSKRGRTVQIHPQEDLIQRLRATRDTEEGRAELRHRVAVEHGLARVQLKQGGRARYKGTRKNTMDLRRYAALNNLYAVERHLRSAA
jgi:hypothetical protein